LTVNRFADKVVPAKIKKEGEAMMKENEKLYNRRNKHKPVTAERRGEMKQNEVVENLINGNIKDARKGAKRYSFENLRLAGEEAGMGEMKAQTMAYFLKTGDSWQRFCDLDFGE
jgi:hypothetical protein